MLPGLFQVAQAPVRQPQSVVGGTIRGESVNGLLVVHHRVRNLSRFPGDPAQTRPGRSGLGVVFDDPAVDLPALRQLSQLPQSLGQRQSCGQIVRLELRRQPQRCHRFGRLAQASLNDPEIVGPRKRIGVQKPGAKVERFRELVTLMSVQQHAQPAVGFHVPGTQTDLLAGVPDLLPACCVKLVEPRNQIGNGRQELALRRQTGRNQGREQESAKNHANRRLSLHYLLWRGLLATDERSASLQVTNGRNSGPLMGTCRSQLPRI